MPKKWESLTNQEKLGFTLNNNIRVIQHYLDDTPQSTVKAHERYAFYSKQMIDENIEFIKSGGVKNYKSLNFDLYNCFEKYPIKNKRVAIIGSVAPWFEAVVIHYGGIPTTIEYNKIETDDPRLTIITVDELKSKKLKKFDVVLSISSYEHDGLGRYGDPINPSGDLESMQYMRDTLLKSKGLLYLAVPIGKDTVVWNAHRIYGNTRWPLLIDGFDVKYSSGYKDGDFEVDRGMNGHQPVFVLKKK
jgi:hypothetical protein